MRLQQGECTHTPAEREQCLERHAKRVRSAVIELLLIEVVAYTPPRAKDHLTAAQWEYERTEGALQHSLQRLPLIACHAFSITSCRRPA